MAQLDKSTFLLPRWGPWDLLRSVQMLKREWGAESNGKQPNLFIPSKTATLVPEIAVEDLPLDRTDDAYRTRGVHKVSFPLVPQLVNQLLREATAYT